MKRQITCAHCGGENVVRDAWASWDIDKQEWVLKNVFDYAYCQDCASETSINETEVTA
jgi:hypothetical protein